MHHSKYNRTFAKTAKLLMGKRITDYYFFTTNSELVLAMTTNRPVVTDLRYII